jgi:ligand-binding sensor domain-containing protein
MTENILLNPILSLLSVFLFFTSCNGQVKTDTHTNKVGEPTTMTSEPSTKMIKKQGTYSFMTHNGPHSDTSVSISAIVEDKKGNIWVATMGEGVYRFNGKTFTNFTATDGLMTNVVYSIMEDKDSNLWFGTTNGVSRYNGKSFTGYPFSAIKGNSIQTNTPTLYTEVPSMLQDKNGKIWLGTTNGVYCYNGATFTNILKLGTITSKLNSDKSDFFAVPSIIEDKEGNIWFTSWSEGLCRFDGTTITIFKSEGHLLSNKGLLQDKNGDIWIAERGYGGVSRYNGKTFMKLFPDLLITDIKEDSKGNIWFATFDRKNNSGGMVCYNPLTNETLSKITVKEKFERNSVTCITIDKSGNVWFGTDKMMLSKYDGKTFTNFSSE